MRILVAEDDPALGPQIRSALTRDGYATDLSASGEEAHDLGASEPYDLVVLDLGLPGMDGISILEKWRQNALQTPVLILTARDGWSDRVDGLDAGADDYLTKPFRMAELSARVRAILRRAKGSHGAPVFEIGNVSFDTRTKNATRDGEAVELTAQEANVLSYLFHNAGRYVSNAELGDHVYEQDHDPDSNTIAVFILRLRKKLGSDLIETSRGRGYRISLPS
jgi:two-component system, OmpR family, response regulator